MTYARQSNKGSARFPRLAGVGIVVLLAVALLIGCIHINRKPIAVFTVSGNLIPGSAISFINTSTDPNGVEDIRLCSWSFGDEEYDDSYNAEHVYRTAGTYIVTLTVYDSDNNVDTFSQTIDIRSRVFEVPDPEAAVVGSGWAFGPPYGVYVPESKKHGMALDGSMWIVDYMYDYRYGALIPENIVFWLPVPLQSSLNQTVVLRVSWRLSNLAGDTLLTYVDPDSYVLGTASIVAGVNTIWDLWGGTEKGSHQRAHEILDPGYYTARLEVRDQESGEAFYWDFAFRVCWGGCR